QMPNGVIAKKLHRTFPQIQLQCALKAIEDFDESQGVTMRHGDLPFLDLSALVSPPGFLYPAKRVGAGLGMVIREGDGGQGGVASRTRLIEFARQGRDRRKQSGV